MSENNVRAKGRPEAVPLSEGLASTRTNAGTQLGTTWKR